MGGGFECDGTGGFKVKVEEGSIDGVEVWTGRRHHLLSGRNNMKQKKYRIEALKKNNNRVTAAEMLMIGDSVAVGEIFLR